MDAYPKKESRAKTTFKKEFYS